MIKKDNNVGDAQGKATTKGDGHMSKWLKLALSKLVTDKVVKEAKEAVLDSERGERVPIDTFIHVKGTVRLGEDNDEAQCHMRANHWAIIAVALSKLNGITIESIVQEAMRIDEKAVEETKIKAKQAIDDFKELTTGFKAGTLTAKLTCEEVTPVQIGEATKVSIPESETV